MKDEMKRKSISARLAMLVVCCLVINLVLPVFNLEVSATDSKPSIPFEMSFEGETEGSMPTGWYNKKVNAEVAVSNPPTMQVEADGASNKVVTLIQAETPETVNYMVYDFTGVKTAVLEYRFKVTATTNEGFLPVLAYGNVRPNAPLYLQVKKDGKVQYGVVPAVWYDAATVTVGEWHTLKEVVDISNDVRKLYIDGKEIALDATILTATKCNDSYELSRVVTGFYHGDTSRGSFYLDDIKVSDKMPVIPFELDFDGETVATMPSGWKNAGVNNLPVTTIPSMLVAADGETNKVACLTQPVKAGTGNYMYYEFTAANVAVLEYRFKVSATTDLGYLPALAYNNKRPTLPLFLRVDAGGKVKYCADNGANWPVIATVSADEWHTLKEVVDIPNNVRRLFVDDQEILLDAAHLEATPCNTSYQMASVVTGFHQNAENGGPFYIDDIKVSSEVPETPAPEAPVTIPFSLNFNSDAVGSMPSKWEHRGMFGYDFTPTTTMLVEADGAENQVVNLTQIQNTATGNYMFYDFTAADSAVLEYRFKVSATTNSGYLPALAYNNGRPNLPIYLRVDTGGKIMYCADNVAWTQIATVTAGQWHTLKEVVDIPKNIRMLYLDGELLTLDAAHLAVTPCNTSYKVASIVTGFQQGQANAGTFYLDDLTVSNLVEGTAVTFDKTEYQLVVSATRTLKPQFMPTDTSIQSMTYVSSNPEIATVDAAGVIKGIAEGETEITATPVQPGLSPVTVKITVVGSVSGDITTTVDTINAPIGAHLFLNASFDYGQSDFELDTSCEYVSANPDVITVDSYGEVLAIAPGSTTITVYLAIDHSIKKEIPVIVTEAPVQKTIYVSPNGTGDGTSAAAPTTLESALTQIAAIDKSTMTGNIEVILTNGYYYRSQALALNENHGGNGTYSVVFKAADGAEPTIGGGLRISGSQFTASNIPGVYVATVPEGTQTRELYIDNVRAVRARSEGKLTNPDFLYDDAGNKIGLVCDDTELLNYQNKSALEFYTLYLWRSGVIGVSEIKQGADGRVQIIMDEEAWHDSRNGAPDEYLAKPENFVYYENAIELLDEPGEWYLDESANKLYYMPRVWENMASLTVTIPVLDCWVEAEKDETEATCGLVTVIGSDYDNMVQNVRFEGITFADATFMRPSSVLGHDAEQGGYLRNGMNMFYQTSVDAAITVKKANGIAFEDCNFTRLGTTALKLTAGVQNARINGNHFSDLSGGCIQIGDPNMRIGTLDNFVINMDNLNPSDVRMRNKNLDVLNNYMHDFGVVYPSVAGVAIGFAENCDMVHNEIFNMSYIGLSIGQATGSYETYNQGNTAINNFVHDYMHGGIFDGGGIYMIGQTKNGLTEGNYLRNQGADTAVLYLDNAARWWTVQRNVVDTSEHPYKIYTPNVLIWWFHANANAKDCIIRNNYSTNNSYAISSNNTENIVMENNTVVADLNWPAEAQSIINTSGLQPAYAVLRKNQAERITTNLPEVGVALATNGSFQVSVSIKDGKDKAVSMANTAVYYEIKDPAVATVSETGVVAAKGKGTTTLRVYVVSNDVVDVMEATVFVGDDLETVELKDISTEIELVAVPGTHLQLEPYGITENGREVSLTNVLCEVANSSVASVDNSGVLTPVGTGETTLQITGTVDGVTKSATYNVIVRSAGTTAYLDDIFEAENEQHWKGDGLNTQGITSWNCVDGESITAELKGVKVYSGTQYGNELLTFNMSFDRVGMYGGITFRGQHAEQAMWGADNAGYLICLHQDGIELHRFNQGVRTIFYGTLQDMESLYGPAIQNFFWEDGRVHKIQIGAINEENGVRLLMYVDGQVIFNVLDTSEDAVRNQGYFGLEGTWNAPDKTKATKFVLQKYMDNSEESSAPTISGSAITSNVATVTAPVGGWEIGENTFTVTADKACIVAVTNDGGLTYTRLTATASGDDYSFTADLIASSQIAVVVAGDANGDGEVTTLDAVRVLAASLDKTSLNALETLGADLNCSNSLTAIDVVNLNAVVLGKTSLNWDMASGN